MRTAIVSDLHLGGNSGTDLAADPELRRVMLEELGSADRIVLLGDTVELRDRPLGDALELATPFLRELGEAASGGEIILVPGNHDHRLAEPLLDRRALGRPRRLGLEHIYRPGAGVGASVAKRLGRKDLVLAYPGIHLRDDVYATHGHYLDCHLNLPRLESLAVAALIRIGGEIPNPAGPDDYERTLAPLYSAAYGFAQARITQRITGHSHPSAKAWARLRAGPDGGLRGRLVSSVLFPATVHAARRLLRRPFESDISPHAISRLGLEAMRDVVERLRIESQYVVFGHTHRAGPAPADGEWTVAGGPRLHNTGTWSWAMSLCLAPDGGRGFWPGTVTWLDETGAPERRQLLGDHPPEQLRGAVRRTLAARAATT